MTPRDPLVLPLFCPRCGHAGPPKWRSPGSGKMEFEIYLVAVLLLLFFGLGLIVLFWALGYSVWRIAMRGNSCERCQAYDLIPVDSPRALAMQREFGVAVPRRVGAQEVPGGRSPINPRPDVEHVVTARNGSLTYRVFAWRHLSEPEAQEVVADALRAGRVKEPPPGGEATVYSDIGKP